MKLERLLATLRDLQVRQYKHDQLAHQDIALSLSVPARLAHFALHFAKYLGAMMRASREGRVDDRHRAIADSFIIALAMANTLNVDLQANIAASGRALPGGSVSGRTTQHELMLYAEIVGDIAKACEATDHLEAFPSRKVLEESIVALVGSVVRLAMLDNLDLPALVETRWQRAEGKSFLFAGQAQSGPTLRSVARVA
ncbi:MAG TPA: hypothetical protein VM074_11725 [Solimonas sp.]|nr:hypothetical protein [Solimonas sp.]